MTDGIGEIFQQETKYFRDRPTGGMVDRRQKPSLYKEYPGSDEIALPKFPPLGTTLEGCIRTRRSVREYAPVPVSLSQISFMIWASAGISGRAGGYEFRTAPSAGALYPIETYLLVNNCAGLKNGIYHYSVRRHSLETVKQGDFGEKLAHASLGQSMCADAPCVFIWSAVFGRSRWKYKDRAYRYVYLEAGHMAQNLALAAVSLGLGTCQIAAFFDDDVNQLIGLDGMDESVIYMSSVGRPA
ncbi:MAG: SagB/ThcOx family dehydrogenase [Candidatus Verstraetearchaeota archaeon]|nr:SagB/ThcOx family dehydrogenase [Candidatus Verstraetearchaeota archaeon]